MAKKKAAARKSATRKKPARKKPAEVLDPVLVDSVVLLIVNGTGPASVAGRLADSEGLPLDLANRYVSEARRKLTLAAKYHRDREIGTAITRLNQIYSLAIDALDFSAALQAQKELDRLLALQQPAPQEEVKDVTQETPESRAIREHLIPLELTDADAALGEHVRIAALFLIDVLEPGE